MRRTRPSWMIRRGVSKLSIGRGNDTKIQEEPLSGPGTEFAKLVSQLGLQSKSGCTCGAVMARMNELGVEGCREKRQELIGQLKENYKLFSTADKAWAAYHAVATGLAFKLNPLDPLDGLFDEALKRADATAAADS